MFAEVVKVQQHGLQFLEVFEELVANPRAAVGQGERFRCLFQPQRIGMEPQQLPKTLMIALGGEDMLARFRLVIEDADLHFLETLVTPCFRPRQGLEIPHPGFAPLLPTDRVILAALVFLRLHDGANRDPVGAHVDPRRTAQRRGGLRR